MVHHTMATASTSAASASRKIHSIALRILGLPRPWRRLAPWLAAALLAAGCVTVPPPPAPPVVPAPPVPALPAAYHQPVAWSALPGWSDDPVHEAWPAFRAGCRALVASATRQALWRPVCAAADGVDGSSAAAVRAFFENHFIPYQVTGADGGDTGLVTGYYEPLLSGSRTRSERHPVPLYGVPDDLLIVDLASLHPELKDKRVRGRVEGRRVVPYWSRSDIEAGRARLDGRTLAFVDDPVEAFFLQIQGSGRVILPDGSLVRVGYSGQNGHDYTAIGKVLIDAGELAKDAVSLQTIRDWLRAHPDRAASVMDRNRSYVFFRVLPGAAPEGSSGVELTAGRSLAVDDAFLPYGVPVWIDGTAPAIPPLGGAPAASTPLRRLVVAQDTGGAITGPVRGDLFLGPGREAEELAGRMKQPVRFWLLLPRGAATLRAGAGK